MLCFNCMCVGGGWGCYVLTVCVWEEGGGVMFFMEKNSVNKCYSKLILVSRKKNSERCET